jgi:hypothetical protein
MLLVHLHSQIRYVILLKRAFVIAKGRLEAAEHVAQGLMRIDYSGDLV